MKALITQLFISRVREVTSDVIRKQLECGVDVINDGEVSKVGYSTYVKDRLTGFEGEASPLPIADLEDFPAYGKKVFENTPLKEMRRPACTGPIAYRDKAALQEDLENFRTALQTHPGTTPEGHVSECGISWSDFALSEKRSLPQSRCIFIRLGRCHEGRVRRHSSGWLSASN